MAFVNGSMTQGNPNSITTAASNLQGEPTPTSLDKKDKAIQNYSNARPRCHHRIFHSIEEFENDDYRSALGSSSTSLLAHMNKPSPSEIRQWMADTQETVDKVVTSWQQQIISRSSKVSDVLDHLIKFVVELEEEDENQQSSSTLPSPSIITAKCENKHGTFESVINVYLHLILISLKQVATTFEKQQGQEEDHRKTKIKQKRQQRLLIEILNQFTMLAGDALKFLQTHDKILEPTCEKILGMRNDLYYFLRLVIQEPQGQIIPMMSNVSLDVISRDENNLWMERCCDEYRRFEMNVSSFQGVDVEAKSYSLLIMQNEEGVDRLKCEDMSVNENLELILLLLRQLDKSIGSSNEIYKGSQATFLEVHTRLLGKFQRLQRNLVAEKKQEKLNPESCSEYLKESLCQLETKFHQVEKVLEEIPHHLRRVIAVADQCSRELIREFGLERQLNLADSPSWTSPIKDISEEFFKSKKSSLPGCLPFLWKIIAKMILGGGGKVGTNKKLKEFWEEVGTEMEEFLKEIKMKEMETGYAVLLRIPTDYERANVSSNHDDFLGTFALAKYASKQQQSELVPQQKLPAQQLELEDVRKQKNVPSYHSDNNCTFTTSHTSSQSTLSHNQETFLILDNLPDHPRQQQTSPLLEGIVKEFKFVSEEYNKSVDERRLIAVDFLEESFSQKSNIPSTSSNYCYNGCNDYSCSSNSGKDKTAAVTHTDKLLLKKKLESYLVEIG